jgi:hypothetical protein
VSLICHASFHHILTNHSTHRARQAGANDPNVGALDIPTQFPTVTTDWRPTLLPGGATTWWEDVYTQTFAKVPDQLPMPGVGQIGYGTLSKKNGKRTAEPAPTGAVATGIAGRYRV